VNEEVGWLRPGDRVVYLGPQALSKNGVVVRTDLEQGRCTVLFEDLSSPCEVPAQLLELAAPEGNDRRRREDVLAQERGLYTYTLTAKETKAVEAFGLAYKRLIEQHKADRADHVFSPEEVAGCPKTAEEVKQALRDSLAKNRADPSAWVVLPGPCPGPFFRPLETEGGVPVEIDQDLRDLMLRAGPLGLALEATRLRGKVKELEAEAAAVKRGAARDD
jgi:hypothetical protein